VSKVSCATGILTSAESSHAYPDGNDVELGLPMVRLIPGILLGIADPVEQDRPTLILQTAGLALVGPQLPQFIHAHDATSL